MSASINDEPVALVSLTREEVQVIMQVLIDAPYIGVNRPASLRDAMCAIANGAIAAGWDAEAHPSPSFRPMVWTDEGYARNDT